MHKYLPHTKKDIEEMLKVIGVDSIDDLFGIIPKNLQLKEYDLPNAMDENTLRNHLHSLANQNKQLTIFRGAGAYDVFTPSAIPALISRQEFLTSYTPYQPEVSQGTLQYIFEYQSMITELTGMEVSNASMYDGSTAAAESMFMAHAFTRSSKILVSSTVNPRTIEVLRTYAKYRNMEVELIPNTDGATDLNYIKENVKGTMGVIVQNPNYYGIVEDYNNFSDVIHNEKGLFIMIADGRSLGVLRTPKEYGADIACGDLQTLGIPLAFGGPYIGYLATDMKYVRKMPGRICGVTNDVDGKRAFVLTLQAREQHIRRAKANSNICSNQSLMALFVTIYLSLLGKKGIKDVIEDSTNGAHYLYNELLKTKKFKAVYNKPFLNEFVLEANFDLEKFNDYLLEQDILGPLVIDNNKALFAVTEKRTQAEIDKLVEMVVDFKWQNTTA